MFKILQKFFPYQVKFTECGFNNMINIGLIPLNLDEETESHKKQVRELMACANHMNDVIGWIRVDKIKGQNIWLVCDIQSDILKYKHLEASIYNRYKYWYRWGFYELLKKAQEYAIEEIWMPTALMVFYKYWVLLRLERTEVKRNDPTIFGSALKPRFQAWLSMYDKTAKLFGGEFKQVWDAENDDYYIIENYWLALEAIYVVNVEKALGLIGE